MLKKVSKKIWQYQKIVLPLWNKWRRGVVNIPTSVGCKDSPLLHNLDSSLNKYIIRSGVDDEILVVDSETYLIKILGGL